MKIYKNPYVSRESYFVKTGSAKVGRAEARASKGYSVELVDGKWEIKEAIYYNHSLGDTMPLVAENRTSIKSVIEQAVLKAVLDSIEV